jgi:hypothetical protein
MPVALRLAVSKEATKRTAWCLFDQEVKRQMAVFLLDQGQDD